MPRRARSPPETCACPSPSQVSRPSGSESSQSLREAWRRACSTSKSVASGRARRTFSTSVVPKTCGSSSTRPTTVRRSSKPSSCIGVRPRVTRPLDGSRKRSIIPARVLLPDPERPTTPIRAPAGTDRDRCSSVVESGAQPPETSESSSALDVGSGRVGVSATRGVASSISCRRAAAQAVRAESAPASASGTVRSARARGSRTSRASIGPERSPDRTNGSAIRAVAATPAPLTSSASPRPAAIQRAAPRSARPARSLARATRSTARESACHITSSAEVCTTSTTSADRSLRRSTASRSARPAPTRASPNARTPESVAVSATLSGVLAFGLARVGAGRAERDAVERRSDLSAEVVEVVQTSAELVMWQADSRAVERVARASDRAGRALLGAARWMAAGRGLALLVSGAGVAATALIAEPFVRSGDLSGPMLALLVLLPLALADLTVPLADAGALSARTACAAARLQEIELATPLVADTPTRPLPTSSALELSDVSGGWAPDSTTLEHLSLSVPAGARIGVVGRSGSGKSTLAGMMLRFLDPSSGRVTLGRTPIQLLGLDDLRTVVGLVDDDPHVFGTTLVENVRLARPDATDLEVEQALRQASLSDWLDSLPDGLDTWLGDGHAQVSGGERARLGIARALLSRQRVLVLDEPIAHLDHATARQLATEVLTGPRDRSIVWITHSPVGLDLVDRTIDLDAIESSGFPPPGSSLSWAGETRR